MTDERPRGAEDADDPAAPPPPPPPPPGRRADAGGDGRGADTPSTAGDDPWRGPTGWGGDGPPPPVTGGAPGAPGGLRPMTLADVLDGTFRLIKDHWRAYLLAVGGVLVPLSLLSNVLLAAVAPEFVAPDFAELLDPAQLEAGTTPFGTDLVVAALVAAGVGFLFTTPISWSVCTVVAGAGLRGETAEPGPAISAGLRRWPSVLAIFLLQAAAYVIAAVVVGLVIAAAVASVGAVGGLVAVPLVLGWVALAVWLYTRWALSFPVAVLEGAGPVQALRRSWALTGTRFWWLLGTLILTVIVASIVGSIASTPLQIVAFAPGLGNFLQAVVISLSAVVSGLISTPVTVNALTLLYTDRRVRREGVDLLPGDAVGGGGAPGSQQSGWNG